MPSKVPFLHSCSWVSGDSKEVSRLDIEVYWSTARAARHSKSRFLSSSSVACCSTNQVSQSDEWWLQFSATVGAVEDHLEHSLQCRQETSQFCENSSHFTAQEITQRQHWLCGFFWRTRASLQWLYWVIFTLCPISLLPLLPSSLTKKEDLERIQYSHKR